MRRNKEKCSELVGVILLFASSGGGVESKCYFDPARTESAKALSAELETISKDMPKVISSGTLPYPK